MPKITYISFDGTPTDVDATDGDSVMQTEVNHKMKGIDGDCGGNKSLLATD